VVPFRVLLVIHTGYCGMELSTGRRNQLKEAMSWWLARYMLSAKVTHIEFICLKHKEYILISCQAGYTMEFLDVPTLAVDEPCAPCQQIKRKINAKSLFLSNAAW
jgi:hypothetical protein